MGVESTQGGEIYEEDTYHLSIIIFCSAMLVQFLCASYEPRGGASKDACGGKIRATVGSWEDKADDGWVLPANGSL